MSDCLLMLSVQKYTHFLNILIQLQIYLDADFTNSTVLFLLSCKIALTV